MKRFIAIALAVTTLFSTNVFAENINVQKNKVAIEVDGEPIYADNFVLNGTTYVPLRTISEEMGCDVQFDNSTKTVAIDSTSTTSSQLLMEYANKGDLIVQSSYLFDALDYCSLVQAILNDTRANYLGCEWGLSINKNSEGFINLINNNMETLENVHANITAKKNNLKELCDNGNAQYTAVLQIYDNLENDTTNLYDACQCIINYSQTKNYDYITTYQNKDTAIFNDLINIRNTITKLFKNALNTYFDVEN